MSRASGKAGIGASVATVAGMAAMMMALAAYELVRGHRTRPAAAEVAPVLTLAVLMAVFAYAVCIRGVPRWLKRCGYGERVSERCGSAATAVAGLISPAAVYAAADGRWTTALLRLSIPVVVIGVGAIWHRFRNRKRMPEPLGLRCPECGYRFGFAREGGAPELCSECGEPWKGRLVPDVAKPPAIFWPTLGLSLLLFVNIPLWISSIPNMLPLSTGTLISWAGAWPSNADVWSALNRRTLDQSQIDELAMRLLDARKRRSHIGIGASRWLDTQVALGGLRPDLRERFFAEMVDLDLELPNIVRVGEPFQIGVVGTRSAGGALYLKLVYGQGARFGDKFVESSAPTGGSSPLLRRFSPRGALPSVATRITPDQPGTVPIDVDAWLIIGTFAAGPPAITWNADGTPVLPPGTEWAERVVLEGTVRVRAR